MKPLQPHSVPPLSARRCSNRWGYTLIELSISLVASAMLLAGLGSAVIISAKAVSPPNSQKAVLDSAEVSYVMADELQSAVHVPEQTATSIHFALADRNSDGEPDNVSYEWQSTTNTLVRQVGAVSGTLLDNVNDFFIHPTLRSIPEILENVLTETSPQAIAGLTSAGNTFSWETYWYTPVAQILNIAKPAHTQMWSISEVKLRLRRNNWYEWGESITVQLRRATGNGLPTSNVLAETTVALSSLSTSYQWITLTATGAQNIPAATNVCIVVFGNGSNGNGRVAYATSGFSGVGNTASWSFYTNSWQASNSSSLYYQLKGTYLILDDTQHVVTRSYITGYEIGIAQHNQPLVRRRVRLMNTPEQLAALWRLDFNENPVDGIDVDYDTVEDWEPVSGTFTGTPSDSVLSLTSGQMFQTTTQSDFEGLITVELRCRGTTHHPAGGGARLEIPFGADDASQGLLTVTADKAANGTQTANVFATTATGPQTLGSQTSLPDGMVDFRIVLDQANNQVGVWINDVYQGRSEVTQPLSTSSGRVVFGASGAAAEFDFLSVRVGRSSE